MSPQRPNEGWEPLIKVWVDERALDENGEKVKGGCWKLFERKFRGRVVSLNLERDDGKEEGRERGKRERLRTALGLCGGEDSDRKTRWRREERKGSGSGAKSERVFLPLSPSFFVLSCC